MWWRWHEKAEIDVMAWPSTCRLFSLKFKCDGTCHLTDSVQSSRCFKPSTRNQWFGEKNHAWAIGLFYCSSFLAGGFYCRICWGIGTDSVAWHLKMGDQSANHVFLPPQICQLQPGANQHTGSDDIKCIYLPTYLPPCLTSCLSVCLSVCLFVCLSVCLSVCFFVQPGKIWFKIYSICKYQIWFFREQDAAASVVAECSEKPNRYI